MVNQDPHFQLLLATRYQEELRQAARAAVHSVQPGKRYRIDRIRLRLSAWLFEIALWLQKEPLERLPDSAFARPDQRIITR